MHRSIRRFQLAVALAAMVVLTGCSNSAPASARAADLQSNGATTANKAVPEDICAMFTLERISGVLGMPVKTGRGESSELTASCSWDAVDGHGRVFAQKLPGGIWNDLSGHDGQRTISGIGDKAYVGVSPAGGVQAGAVAAGSFYHVVVDPAPSEDDVVRFLRAFLNQSRH